MIHRQKPVMLNTRLICIAIICIAIPISIIGFSWSRNSALLLTEQTIHRSEHGEEDGVLISSNAVDSINWRVIAFSPSLSLRSQLFRSSTLIIAVIVLVNAMAGGESAISEQPENNEYVKQPLSMLEHSCGSSMSLSSVAERPGLSSVYLGKIFKRVTGVNYVQYLTDLRMEKARELLLQDNIRIQEIAEQLGYSQSHYFSKIFKHHFAQTSMQHLCTPLVLPCGNP